MPADEKTETKESGGTASPVESSPLAIAKEKPQHVEFIDTWAAFYLSRAGEPFKKDRAHFVIASKLIGEYGLEAVVQKARTLAVICEKRSAWFTKDGWACFTPEVLSSKWNLIIPQSHRPTKEDEFEAELKKQDEAELQRKEALIGKADAIVHG